MQSYKINSHGDSTLAINFGSGIDENTNNIVHLYINIFENIIIINGNFDNRGQY